MPINSNSRPKTCNALCIAALSFSAQISSASGPTIEIQPGTARPGDAILVQLRHVSEPPSGSLGAAPLSFFRVAGDYWALEGLSVEQAVGELEVKIKLSANAGDSSAPELTGSIEVRKPDFNERELKVANRYIRPSRAERKRIREDRIAFDRAYHQAFEPPQFTGNFIWPLDHAVTAHFGDLRLFNGEKEGQHFGTDLQGRTGDPVVASNGGSVVLARRCFASGNTVIVHHGIHLFTAYFHLSKIAVRDGERVKQGQLIGRVGNTGRVTGPHLHWAVKIDGQYVDAESLVRIRFR
jgi:murein DD-endopeptidase MepM/ murein hydrolase activator NlpD